MPDYGITRKQISNLKWLANHLEEVVNINATKFDMKTPYAVERGFGGGTMPMSPLAVYHREYDISKHDAMALIAIKFKPQDHSTWHDFIERATGFSAHNRNANAWRFMFGTIDHDDLSPLAVANRIRHILAGKEIPESGTAPQGPSREEQDEAWVTKQADEFLPDFDTPLLDAKHVSLKAVIRNAIHYGRTTGGAA